MSCPAYTCPPIMDGWLAYQKIGFLAKYLPWLRRSKADLNEWGKTRENHCRVELCAFRPQIVTHFHLGAIDRTRRIKVAPSWIISTAYQTDHCHWRRVVKNLHWGIEGFLPSWGRKQPLGACSNPKAEQRSTAIDHNRGHGQQFSCVQ